MVCLVCFLNGLSMGCSSTDVGASNYRCMDDEDCRTGLICHPVRKACEPPAVIVDGGVSGDCRMAANACASGFSCQQTMGMWTCLPGGQTDAGAPSCRDGIRSGRETDVDCGGPNCGGCEAGLLCLESRDCLSTVCDNNRCTEASCTDGVLNGSETSTDCGGTCSGCGTGSACAEGSDCLSGVCTDGRCAAPSCSDDVQNQGESDIDLRRSVHAV